MPTFDEALDTLIAAANIYVDLCQEYSATDTRARLVDDVDAAVDAIREITRGGVLGAIIDDATADGLGVLIRWRDGTYGRVPPSDVLDGADDPRHTFTTNPLCARCKHDPEGRENSHYHCPECNGQVNMMGRGNHVLFCSRG